MENQVMQRLNHNGFTFIELLLVLSVTFLISTAVIIAGKNYSERKIAERFLQQLTLDLYAIQSHALSEQTSAKLEFVAGGREYNGQGKSRVLLFRRELPPAISLSPQSAIREVTYYPTGTVEKFGTMQFITESGEMYTVRLQFGKGRVVLPEF